MTPAEKALYEKAVRIAAEPERRFLEAVDRERRIGDRAKREKYFDLFTGPAAHEACAQQELIAELFGVSAEKVHNDIARALEGGGQ
ncbi:hypothetical protein [Parvibacter caecicola]|uniref:hypothetical protein n=1 Tax=Parvibacter caecicola TaxID=747645 RepID=UPI00273185B5|nr:hypothetical protein [Parvibacter caecicola]